MEKNKKNLLRNILLVILVIIIIFLILIIRNFIIITNLENLAKNKVNSKNYVVERYTLQGDTTNIVRAYNKDSKKLTILKSMNKDITDIRGITTYQDEEEGFGIIEADGNKILLPGENIVGMNLHIRDISEFHNGKAWYKIILSATSKITSEKCNNKECYLVEVTENFKIWYDKETGLIVREINGSSISNYYYQFDIVQDSDIEKPDTTGCIEPNSN